VTALIKAHAGHAVRRFAEGASIARAVAASSSPAESAEAVQMAVLTQELAELRRTIAADREAAARAAAKAREEGRREGREQARRDDEARIAALGEGLSGARAAWDERIGELDGLATLVARAAIARMFDACANHADFVAGMVARQLRHLRHETVLLIRVSPEDFTDDAALAGLGAGAIAVERDDTLSGGQCRIDLQLGHLDLCSRAHWAEMSALLHQLSEAEAAA
jgi:flagellar biosynthesis/type III secretory pathway protein FliH